MLFLDEATRESIGKMDYLSRVRLLSALISGKFDYLSNDEAKILAAILMVRNDNPKYIPDELRPINWKNPT